MPNGSVVSIGLNIDYQKSLQQMTNDFNQALTRISNEAKKTRYTADIEQQIGALKGEIQGFSDVFRAEFEKIKSQQIDSSNFKKFETEVTQNFENIAKKFSSVNTKIYDLNKQLGLLNGSDFASGMKRQFDELSQKVLHTYKGLQEIVGLTKTPPQSPVTKLDKSAIEEYKKTLTMIKQLESEAVAPASGTWGQMKKELEAQEVLLRDQLKLYDSKRAEMSSIDPSSGKYRELENELVRIQIQANMTAAKIQNIFTAAEQRGFKPVLADGTESLIGRADSFIGEINSFEGKIRGMIRANREAQNSVKQTQESFNTFQIKDGAIHIPIDIATKSSDLKNRLNEIVQELKAYAQSTPIIAPVKLVLDKSSSKGYVKNSELDKQQVEGQKEQALDISKTIQNTYRAAAREAKQIVRTEIATIQKEFESVPIKLKPDTESFKAELQAMLNESFKAIAEGTTGLSVNSELEKLVTNLREISTTLSGNGNFKFGLDEASIGRITAAINNMANMIQRAFGVASDSDITAQWSTIEGKFKAVANEAGHIDARTKKNKQSMMELAVEYKKYIDMGGSKKLSELTNDADTVKRLTGYYEELGRAVQEAVQKQEQAKKKPTSTKISSEEKDAINAVSRENKKLETQAGKTGTALDNEGKKAQSAAEKFRKLAKEKGTAVVANRELAKAAKETADALERESKVRKETGTKTSKGAVDSNAYATNALKWQRDIRQSLIDGGSYEEVYGAKISQAANGVVKFTANVRVGEQEWKKFTATVSDTGAISNPTLTDLTEKQVISIEKAKAAWEKYVAAMASGGVDPTFFNRSEMEEYIQTILKAEEGLDKFKIKKVSLNSDGKLAITAEIKEADGQIKTFIANFSSVDDIIDGTTGSVRNLSQALEQAFNSGKFMVTQDAGESSALSRYKEIYAVAQKLGNLNIKIAGLDSTKNANQVQELTAQYQQLEKVYTRLVGEFFKDADIGKVPVGAAQELNSIFENIGRQIDEIKAKLRDASVNTAAGFGLKAQSAFDSFVAKYEGNANWSMVADDVARLRDSVAGIDSQGKLKEFERDLSSIAAKLRSIDKDNRLGSLLGGQRAFKDINEVRANIDSLFASIGKVNEKSIRVSGTNKLTADIKKVNGEIHKMTVQLDSNGFARFVDNGITQFGRLREVVSGVFKGIFGYFRYYLSPYMLVSYTRRAIEQVKEVDNALTELRKVSDASAEEVAAYFGEAAESAKKLGSSVKDMISATADWSRMGYSLPDAKQLGEIAVLYKNVGDGIDIDAANESLVSTIQGFRLQAKDAMSVIDSFNEVSNNYAISSAGIGEALKRSAAAFNAANTDLNQSIALITAGNEIVQSPEKVGTMWQTVTARIRGTKTELEELGESTDDVLSTSKLQSLVKGYTGVDIMKDKDTYKDIYTIVSEIGEKWHELEDVERAALLEGLAGKKQSNTLAAVLNNADRLKEIYETAEGSAGSAQREQERYTESLQYSIDQLTAHVEEFWYTFLNKDDVKGFIDLINTLLGGLTSLVGTFGSIPSMAGILGGLAAIKNFGRPKMFGLKLLF